MAILAVIDTNVLVSALLSKHEDTGTVRVWRSVLSRVIKPVYSTEILEEYYEALHRKEGKYDFSAQKTTDVIQAIIKNGIKLSGIATEEKPSDPDDVIFYEVTMDSRQTEDTFLVTGNIKDFPIKPFVVRSEEMIRIVEKWRGK